MRPESLIASAAINFGVAFIILFLFSILKKQPSNALIYYARLLSATRPGPSPSFPPLSLRRFLPSVAWIPKAFHLSEDQILQIHGLDVLVLFRLFKFGINFFGVSSLLGLAVVVPVNYGSGNDDHTPSKIRHTMDPFSISNVPAGSNRLWVHFTCLCFISLYGLCFQLITCLIRCRIQNYLVNKMQVQLHAIAMGSVEEILGDLNRDAFVSLLEKVIGESEHVQNNPPELIPQEVRVANHVLEVLRPLSTEHGGPLIVNHVSYAPGRSNLIVEYPGTKAGQILSFVGMHMDVVTANPSD